MYGRGLIGVFLVVCCFLHATVLEKQVVSAEEFSWPMDVAEGPLPDTSCNVEVVEKANSNQLHSILNELLNTTYFRMFSTSLNRRCKFFGRAEPKPESGKPIDASKHTGASCGTTLPFTSKPACEVESAGGFADEQEKSASPGFMQSESKSHSQMSNDHVDGSISREEKASMEKFDAKTCDDENLPDFWLNLCSDTEVDDEKEVYNLLLNEERWTGYNGSHVWDAIYQENCFVRGDETKLCYEERVLYRLLSAMHTSTNIHINLKYYPPQKGVRDAWAPNPQKFMQQYGAQPERLKNLHFGFVVMLRALLKAKTFLLHTSYDSVDDMEAARTMMLMKRLLDSNVLKSCNPAFEAFDESLLFKNPDGSESSARILKSEFKGVFQNVTRLLDCVTCQKCKLHGKLKLLGIGASLKILLLPEQMLRNSISREEVVAFINTLGTFSASISAVDELSSMYWESFVNKRDKSSSPLHMEDITMKGSSMSKKATVANSKPEISREYTNNGVVLSLSNREILADLTVRLVSNLGKEGAISDEQEDNFVDAALNGDARLLLLAKHYESLPDKFIRHAVRTLGRENDSAMRENKFAPTRVAIVGGGLAGLTAALTLLDRGAEVALFEKEAFIGGNSAKASSGINGVDTKKSPSDSVSTFTADILKSGNLVEGTNSSKLACALAEGSVDALEYMRERVGLPLEKFGQLGGHSKPRTHRPADGMAGSELVFGVQKKLKEYELAGKLTIQLSTIVHKLVLVDGRVVGLESYKSKKTSQDKEMSKTTAADHVVITTGGYASDFTNSSLLQEFRPDLIKLTTTNGKFATGDGIKMAREAGAEMVDLKHVQVHPTAWVDPADPQAHTKMLAAEILRGVGGLLINKHGKRFVNEMGTRDYVTEAIMRNDPESGIATLFLTKPMAAIANKHVPFYKHKGLLKEFKSLRSAAEWMKVDARVLRQTLMEYNRDAANKVDEYGKDVFENTPLDLSDNLYLAGQVTPSLHYSMGGIRINKIGQVLRRNGDVIKGLWSAGEAVGGIHGKNRLGGNALTECVVFGRIVGKGIPLAGQPTRDVKSVGSNYGRYEDAKQNRGETQGKTRIITKEELLQHKSKEDCWVVIDGNVYDFTSYLEEHPGGVKSILQFGGGDGTELFDTIHTRGMLDSFSPLGKLENK